MSIDKLYYLKKDHNMKDFKDKIKEKLNIEISEEYLMKESFVYDKRNRINL